MAFKEAGNLVVIFAGQLYARRALSPYIGLIPGVRVTTAVTRRELRRMLEWNPSVVVVAGDQAITAVRSMKRGRCRCIVIGVHRLAEGRKALKEAGCTAVTLSARVEYAVHKALRTP